MTPVLAIDRVRQTGTRIRSAWPLILEILLAALLLVQLVRLMWAVVTPSGPLGEWRGKAAVIPSAEARASLFRSFDPFYPAPVASAQSQNVTSLSLILYGVRVNEGSGLGSAIIAGPDEVQGSYAVGDEIQPGVTLKAVLFDHVVIDRGGVEETLFLDQSQPVAPVTPSAASEAEAAPNPSLSAAGAIEMLKAGIGLAPRLANGRITGLVVSSKGPGFAAAGFREGDIITKIGDRPVGSAGDLSALQQMLVPGARIGLTVERGASEVPIAILVPAQ